MADRLQAVYLSRSRTASHFGGHLFPWDRLSPMIIRVYDDVTDRESVVRLWKQLLGYGDGHNHPELAIEKKLKTGDNLFWVATDNHQVVGTIMAGYDGHRGWIYSLAVCLKRQRRGIGSALLRHAETALDQLGCMKINLQITDTNSVVAPFYQKHGYAVEPRISMGKKLVRNAVPVTRRVLTN